MLCIDITIAAVFRPGRDRTLKVGEEKMSNAVTPVMVSHWDTAAALASSIIIEISKLH